MSFEFDRRGFAKKETVFYRGQRKLRPVQDGISTQEHFTQVILWLKDRALVTSVEISGHDERCIKEEAIFLIGSQADLLLNYRVARLLDAVRPFKRNASENILPAFRRKFLLLQQLELPRDSAQAEQQRQEMDELAALCQPGEFEHICRCMPKDMEGSLQAMVQAKCTMQMGTFIEEVRVGHLSPSAYLKSLGVDHPDVLHLQEQRRLAEVEERLGVHIEAFLVEHEHVGCDCDRSIRRIAAYVYSVGIKEDDLVLAFAFAANQLQSFSKLYQELGMMGVLLAGGDVSMPQTIGATARHVARTFPGSRDAVALEEALSNLLESISQMPFVAE